MLTPILNTDKLILWSIREEDAEEIFKCWMDDEEVSRYMLCKASDDVKEAKEFVRFELGNLDNPNWNCWIIVLKASAAIIGTCLLLYNDEEMHWDVSYNLGKRYWSKGYVTESMKKVMCYAKNTLGIKECATAHAIENPSSGRVLEKLGFKYEKEVPYVYSMGELETTGKYYSWTAVSA